MSKILDKLEPTDVFKYFEEICEIPHGSYNEAAISNYLVDYAKKQGLDYVQDKLGNVVIYKVASPGREEEEPIVIQGHMDMVCEKTSDCILDMETEGLQLQVEGDYISAKGTTLGGDDGIAIAMGLAILAEDKLQHPALELVCTISEEVGMIGAHGIDASLIRGRRLINIDSEEEGVLTAGCAGGIVLKVDIPIQSYDRKESITVEDRSQEEVYRLTVDGLLGGHSGTDIDGGKANACELLGETLAIINEIMLEDKLDEGDIDEAKSIEDCKLIISNISCNGKNNAIPRSAYADILIDEEQLELINKGIDIFLQINKLIYSNDKGLNISLTKLSNQEESARELDSNYGASTTANIVNLINMIPNGVVAYSKDVEGAVETSLNLGRIEQITDAKGNACVELEYLIRSNISQEMTQLMDTIDGIVGDRGVTNYSERYEPWQYMVDSPFRDKMVTIYETMYGKKPGVDVIHAGLECGILSDKLEGLEAVSIGPDILDIHTPDERLSISSTVRVYDYVKSVISAK